LTPPATGKTTSCPTTCVMLSSLIPLLPVLWTRQSVSIPPKVVAKQPTARHNSTQKLCLPDTLKKWQWPRQLNPHYAEVSQASSAWVTSFRAFSPRAQKAFDRCNFGMATVSSLKQARN
jgi:hypothetical protein